MADTTVDEQKKENWDIRLNRCIPVARKILELIAEKKPMIGNTTREEVQDSYAPLVEEVLKSMLAENIAVHESKFAFGLALQTIDFLQNMTLASTDITLLKMKRAVYNKDEEDVTFQEADEILKRVPSEAGSLVA